MSIEEYLLDAGMDVDTKEPIMKTIPLFHTPKSMEELQSAIDSLPAKERALVYPYVFMMYNLMVTKVINDPTDE